MMSTERTSYSRKLRLVPGLQNFGNNCFFNVIMQSLASCVVFQPFLQKLVREFQLHEGRMSNTFPLTVSLAALVEELSAIHLKRVVLSPWKVMRAMAYHAPNFNLTNQQDAVEAFLQLVSCLKEEISDYNQYPHRCSLVDVFGSNGCNSIITSKSKCRIEFKRWQYCSLGPCDGILGSILTCQTCSSRISLSFETFQNLPLSPVLQGDSTVVVGCTLLDCLKLFFAVEKIENYCCSYCWYWQWHNISLAKLFHFAKHLWSKKRPSCALTQLTIASCPKILCIHLNRVSVNVFGDLVKVEGHISFPLIMDMFPFMMMDVEIKDLEEQFRGQHSTSNIKQNQESVAARKTCLYRLVSVVEHFGIVGGGHYTVYRRVQDSSSPKERKKRKRRVQDDQDQWFYASDSEVHLVSEQQVLGAKAMLLFYEKI